MGLWNTGPLKILNGMKSKGKWSKHPKPKKFYLNLEQFKF